MHRSVLACVLLALAFSAEHLMVCNLLHYNEAMQHVGHTATKKARLISVMLIMLCNVM